MFWHIRIKYSLVKMKFELFLPTLQPERVAVRQQLLSNFFLISVTISVSIIQEVKFNMKDSFGGRSDSLFCALIEYCCF